MSDRTRRRAAQSVSTALAVFVFAACSDPEPAAAPEAPPESAPLRAIAAHAVPEPPPPRAPAEPEEPAPELAVVASSTARQIRVQTGENLTAYAAWSGLSVDEIAAYNELDRDAPLRRGQRLELALPPERAAEFFARREQFAARRLERFLAKRGGLIKVVDHAVETGESAWSVARQHGRLPLWVLEHYNAAADLDRLSPGDVVRLPLTARDATASRGATSRVDEDAPH